MKGLNCCARFWRHVDSKKSPKRTQGIDGFGESVTPATSRLTPFIRNAVAGLLGELITLAMQSMPATVLFYALYLTRGGHARLQVAPGRVRLRAFRFLLLCHYVKEYIVTITNHIRRIEDLAEQVIENVDDREYGKAHCALDDITNKVRLAHEHIDHLQDVTPRIPVPAGD